MTRAELLKKKRIIEERLQILQEIANIDMEVCEDKEVEMDEVFLNDEGKPEFEVKGTNLKEDGVDEVWTKFEEGLDELKEEWGEEKSPNQGFEVGDLVFAKNMGHQGLVGLVVGNPTKDEEFGTTIQDVYFRGLGGEVHTMELSDIEDLLDSDKLFDANKYGDIEHYKTIAARKNIALNPKYEEALEDQGNDEEFFEESDKEAIEKVKADLGEKMDANDVDDIVSTMQESETLEESYRRKVLAGIVKPKDE